MVGVSVIKRSAGLREACASERVGLGRMDKMMIHGGAPLRGSVFVSLSGADWPRLADNDGVLLTSSRSD